MFSLSTILWMCSSASSGFNWTGKKKALKCNDTSSSHLVCQAVWPRILNAAFCIHMWIFIWNSTNIWKSILYFFFWQALYTACREENTMYVPLICQYVGSDESQNGLVHPYIMAIEFYSFTCCMVSVRVDVAAETMRTRNKIISPLIERLMQLVLSWTLQNNIHVPLTCCVCQPVGDTDLGGLQESGFTLYVCLFQVIIERRCSYTGMQFEFLLLSPHIQVELQPCKMAFL